MRPFLRSLFLFYLFREAPTVVSAMELPSRPSGTSSKGRPPYPRYHRAPRCTRLLDDFERRQLQAVFRHLSFPMEIMLTVQPAEEAGRDATTAHLLTGGQYILFHGL